VPQGAAHRAAIGDRGQGRSALGGIHATREERPVRTTPPQALYDRGWSASCMSSRLNLQYEGLGLGYARMAGMNPVKTTTTPMR
jgi:hypothetical protein